MLTTGLQGNQPHRLREVCELPNDQVNARPRFTRNTRFWPESYFGANFGENFLHKDGGTKLLHRLRTLWYKNYFGMHRFESNLFVSLTTIKCCTVSCEHRFAFNSHSTGVRGDRTCVNIGSELEQWSLAGRVLGRLSHKVNMQYPLQSRSNHPKKHCSVETWKRLAERNIISAFDGALRKSTSTKCDSMDTANMSH